MTADIFFNHSSKEIASLLEMHDFVILTSNVKGTESHMRKKREKKKIVKNCYYIDVFACKALIFAD